MDSLWLLIPKGKPVPPIIRWIVVGLVPCLAVKSGVGNGGNNDRVLPSARVTCSLYAQYMAKSNGKSLPTFIAVSTLSTSQGRGKKQGGHTTVAKGTWVGFPIAFSTNLASLAMQNDENYCQYFICNVGNTGFNYGGNASYNHWISFIAFGL